MFILLILVEQLVSESPSGPLDYSRDLLGFSIALIAFSKTLPKHAELECIYSQPDRNVNDGTRLYSYTFHKTFDDTLTTCQLQPTLKTTQSICVRTNKQLQDAIPQVRINQQLPGTLQAVDEFPYSLEIQLVKPRRITSPIKISVTIEIHIRGRLRQQTFVKSIPIDIQTIL